MEEQGMDPGSSMERESPQVISRRRFAKVVVAALGVTSLVGAGLSGALARHSDGWDDDSVFGGSGGSGGLGGSGGSGGSWDDDWVFPSSGGSGWDDDDWDDD